MNLTNFIPLIFIAIYALIPLAAATWALYTLHRIRTTLDRIEQRLQRS
jgi:hypothetical protein